MPEIPRDKWPESTLALLRDPYQFISKRCRRYWSDLFQTRLMFRKTICMTGPEAAALFYDEDRFTREGVAPGWLKKTLFGKGGVQGLDGEAHQHRKQMFMSLMAPERIDRLGSIATNWCGIYARKWAGMDQIVLYEEVNEILSRAVCDWAGYADLFAQEVRRLYPFFPAVMARVRHDFDWKGFHFPEGRLVALDLYGTNHDPRTWEEPEAFQPEQFRRWDGCPFNFIPQGGGDHHKNHRCPGEWIAIELIKVSSNFLAGGVRYDVPEQDLSIDYARLPALPKSRFVIRNVRLLEGATREIKNR
ncbi:MAG: cytochrome P450 [Planctomycetes bacterium]|nr:cytochrome P450 [Planctomycetota bacterium]